MAHKLSLTFRSIFINRALLQISKPRFSTLNDEVQTKYPLFQKEKYYYNQLDILTQPKLVQILREPKMMERIKEKEFEEIIKNNITSINLSVMAFTMSQIYTYHKLHYYSDAFWMIIEQQILDKLQSEKDKNAEYHLMDLSYIASTLGQAKKGSDQLWDIIYQTTENLFNTYTPDITGDNLKVFDDSLFLIKRLQKNKRQCHNAINKIVSSMDSSNLALDKLNMTVAFNLFDTLTLYQKSQNKLKDVNNLSNELQTQCKQLVDNLLLHKDEFNLTQYSALVRWMVSQDDNNPQLRDHVEYFLVFDIKDYDLQQLSLVLQVFGKFFRNYLRNGVDNSMTALAQQVTQMFSQIRLQIKNDFTAEGFSRCMRSLGELNQIIEQEIGQPPDPILIALIQKDMRSRSLQEQYYILTDMIGVLSGIKNFKMKNIDNPYLQKLIKETQYILKKDLKISPEEYVLLFSLWAHIAIDLDYRQKENMQTLCYSLSDHLLYKLPASMSIDLISKLCTIIAKVGCTLPHKQMSKLGFKLESVLFINVIKANKKQLVNIISGMGNIYSGGTLMLWKHLDTIFNKRIEEFTIRELEKIHLSFETKTVQKYYLRDETKKIIEERLALLKNEKVDKSDFVQFSQKQ